MQLYIYLYNISIFIFYICIFMLVSPISYLAKHPDT